MVIRHLPGTITPWVRETVELARKAFEWPIKQLKRVQDDVAKIAALKDRPGIKSVTLITGPGNGFLYGPSEECDIEMACHAEVWLRLGSSSWTPTHC